MSSRMKKRDKVSIKIESEAGGKKILKGLHWRINPEAFLKSLGVKVELPKKERIDLTDHIPDLPTSVTLFYHPKEGLTIFGESKVALKKAIEFMINFHAVQSVSFFTKDGSPRIFGHVSLPKPVMEQTGFTLDTEEDRWFYPGPSERKAKKKDKTEKAKKKVKAAAPTSRSSLKRDPAALAEIFNVVVASALKEGDTGMGFNVPLSLAFDLHGYKRLNAYYFSDLIRNLEEYGLGIIFGVSYWTLFVLKEIPKLRRLRKAEFNHAIKELQKLNA